MRLSTANNPIFEDMVVRPPEFEPGLEAWEASVLDQARPRPHVTHWRVYRIYLFCTYVGVESATVSLGKGKVNVYPEQALIGAGLGVWGAPDSCLFVS